MAEYSGKGGWRPWRHWLFFWRLERVAWSNWAGSGIQYYREDEVVRVFMTRESAQRKADQLNEESEDA